MIDFPLITIIVPVYNSEDSLIRCIDSIIMQTYENFELILIDDGSLDLSGKICDDYIKRDGRVVVYHTENGGVSSARNLGLDNAHGEWITFCDSDDWLSPKYLENLLSNADDDIDLVFSYGTIVYKDGSSVREVYSSRKISISDMELAIIENDFHLHSSPWAKLYRKSLIETQKLRFCKKMHIGEDAVFLFSYMLNCRYIYISNNTDYFYNFETNNSLTKRVNSVESEIYGYTKIENLLHLLRVKGNIKNIKALHKLNWMKGYYIRRILNSVYHNKLKRKRRLEIIRNLELNAYLNEIHIPALKEKILAKLLQTRHYCLYDLIRIIAKFCKR